MLHGWRCSGRITGQVGACEEGKGECMKYMRFMGQQEYETLMRGEELENHTDWKAARKNSDSVGFCFLTPWRHRRKGCAMRLERSHCSQSTV